MKAVLGVIVGIIVLCLVAAALRAGLPLGWFGITSQSIPPEAMADYLSGLFDATWVLSVAYGAGGFFGTWVSAALGGISRFRYVALFSVVMSGGMIFEGASYFSGSVIAIIAMALSMVGGAIGLRKSDDQTLQSAANAAAE